MSRAAADVRVGPAWHVGVEPGAQAGAFGGADPAGFERRQVGHQVPIPAVIEGAHDLLDEDVGGGQRQVHRSGERDRPGAVVGGVTVASGDLVAGDRDGVVVVPRAEIDAVIQALEAVRAAEAALEAKVKAGLKVPDFVQDLLASERVRRLD